MPQKVRKAVFPAAGLGTRFLPATKASPKEMLPLVDKPLIQYAVEDNARGIAAKRQSPRRHFVQDDAEGKQIRARIEFPAAHLLRRHISHRAQRRAGTG